MTAQKPITAKQDAFARRYVETGNASKAYREARMARASIGCTLKA